ncbi:MAG: family 20 glycosylhydrolase [Acidobacteria bacterium]|nr:family 20 glycosylhydrolase [Acidobacteriota bacterium]
MSRLRSVAGSTLLLVVACAPADAPVSLEALSPVPSRPINVVPAPQVVESADGGFRFSAATRVAVVPEFAAVTRQQLGMLRDATGYSLEVDPEQGRIAVRLDVGLPAEGYRLQISSGALQIDAADEAGVFYAFQTISQMLPRAEAGSSDFDGWSVPAGRIEDWPRFPYRGMHLDVGRHFFDVAFVKRYIDTMARFKFNQFHWHLTEDQGWRVEIDAYPRLTSVGAWRSETTVDKNVDPYIGDGVPHGGYYTKDEIREIVAYAAERFVTVIPEIEMPGHATAAIAAYPELGCTGAALEVSTNWGVHDTIFCPSEATFDFIEAVLAEVVELFPSEYIHIGADEVPKRQWRESELAQQIIQREGLADEDELQSWFIRRVEVMLAAHGRRLVGWDEILEGGLAPDATVMSWRGTEGGIAAAQQGHDVIMTPVEHADFDFYQGDPATEPLAMSWAGFGIDLATVYAFEPVPDVLTDDEAVHILGPQANVWTEYIKTADYVEYMAYPRAIALSEVAWSARGARDYDGFLARLRAIQPLLDELELNYRPLDH